MKLAKALRVVGRISLTAGVLTLLFVAYQLWGTGLHEARAQGALSDEMDEALSEAGVDTEGDGSDLCAGTVSTANEEPPSQPAAGDPVARIALPKIGVNKVVVEGVSVSDLKRGPGHFTSTPLPGQEGNVAIAGHRTTYGAPFHRIDELDEGDEILVTTVQGCFRYVVSEQRIVTPDQVEVLDDFGDNRLTLAACHPKYSAAQRIIVVAELDGEALPAPDQPPEDPPTDDLPREGEGSEEQTSDLEGATGLSGDRQVAWPTVLFGLTCALVWLAAWLAAKMVKPWLAYGIGTPLFLVALFFFFEEISRLLPANF